MRSGIIGASGRGMFLAWQSLQNGNVPIAVADPSEACRERAVAIFGKMGYPLRAYETDRAMLEQEDNLQAVFIGSPDHVHYENMLACLDFDCAVYAEKPLVQQVAHAVDLHGRWLKHPIPLCGGLELRYSKMFAMTQELLRRGTIGEPCVFHVREEVPGLGMHVHPIYRRKETGRSLLLQKGVHDLDLINWFADAAPTRVFATGGQAFSGPDHRPADYDPVAAAIPQKSDYYADYLDCTFERVALDPYGDEVDMEDHYHVTIDYEGDKHATFTLAYNSPCYQHEFVIHGTEGKMTTFFNHKENTATISWHRLDGKSDTREFSRADLDGGHGGGDPKILAAFVDMVANGTPTEADMTAACTAAMVGAAAQDAIETGVPVALPKL
jgi:predicted dehydrogenase